MTEIYFVRHCESNHNDHDDRTRRLTDKGLKDTKTVTEYLKDKKIDCIYSSPYQRTLDTVRDFAEYSKLDITVRENLKEIVLDDWVENFLAFIIGKFANRDSEESGESLNNCQKRNIEELNQILEESEGKNIAVSTHGMALSMIINYYDPSYGYEDFVAMLRKTPWIVHMSFEGKSCIKIEKVDII